MDCLSSVFVVRNNFRLSASQRDSDSGSQHSVGSSKRSVSCNDEIFDGQRRFSLLIDEFIGLKNLRENLMNVIQSLRTLCCADQIIQV